MFTVFHWIMIVISVFIPLIIYDFCCGFDKLCEMLKQPGNLSLLLLIAAWCVFLTVGSICAIIY